MKLFTQSFTNKKPTANRFLSRRYVKFSAVVLMITSTLSVYTYSGYAYSEDSPLKSVDLSTAISQTMNMHPELKVFASQADIYKGYVQQAGIQVRPEIGLTIEDAMGTGDHSGFKSAQSTLSISWILDNSLVKNRVAMLKFRDQPLHSREKLKR